jgi:hypothetical protein
MVGSQIYLPYLQRFVCKTFIIYILQKVVLKDIFVPKARFRRRTSHVPNLIDELGTAEERRMYD